MAWQFFCGVSGHSQETPLYFTDVVDVANTMVFGQVQMEEVDAVNAVQCDHGMSEELGLAWVHNELTQWSLLKVSGGGTLYQRGATCLHM